MCLLQVTTGFWLLGYTMGNNIFTFLEHVMLHIHIDNMLHLCSRCDSRIPNHYSYLKPHNKSSR